MKKVIMSGNEAIARGAYEAGCAVAAAYPGTPSTEILESMSGYKEDVFCHWACNEKVATEIALGASIGGARALCAMKHVGVNVAADPLFTMGYAGVNGGLVVVTADDPGCHSSQNEQDNRLYAPHMKIGMMEPSDSEECRVFTAAAFELSERFDVPMLIRVTTRTCHSQSLVTIEDRSDTPVKKYVRDPAKYAMVPANARGRHIVREKLISEMEDYANDCPFNRVEMGTNHKIGIITSGISYQYAREAFGDSASYLKLGLTFPYPRKLIQEFAEQFETIYVIEENEPYLENVVKSLGIDCIGKDRLPICGELNAQIIRSRLIGVTETDTYSTDVEIPTRPPVLCAGCPHRGFFHGVNRNLKRIVPVGDIGCYSLGVSSPLDGLDYLICMGAGLSSTIGLSKALELQGDTRKVLGMLGDSTFYHSGITSLIDIVVTNANVIACILDNSITAMTGHQDNPGTGRSVMGDVTPVIDIETVVRSLGLGDDRIRVIDPLDRDAVMDALESGINTKGPFVIITKSPCALLREVVRRNAGRHCVVDEDKCRGCRQCMKISCPAIAFENKKANIRVSAGCNGCGLCMQICPIGAVSRVEVRA
jgi:indolepyruvate ferredoxin oxidoreductase alpha subunit